MRYDLEIEIEGKRPVVELNCRIDRDIVREFKTVAKANGVSMTHVITKMLKEFVNEYQNRVPMRQRRL